MEDLRSVSISVDNESMVVDFEQGNMNEDEFFAYVIDYILSNIQIEVL